MRIRHGHRQVAAQADQRLGPAFGDRQYRCHRIVAVLGRWFEAVGAADAVQQRCVGFLGDAHRAVALHVGMPAQRTDARTRLADVAAHQQQVGDLLHVVHAVAVLGDAHAVADDHPLGLRVHRGGGFDLRTRQSRIAFDRLPRCRVQIGFQRIEPRRVRGDEVAVDHALAAVAHRLGIHRQQRLHHALEHRDIAADARLVIGRRDAYRLAGQHLGRILRRDEALQATLRHRVEDDDGRLAQRHLAQRAQHARMVGAGVVADAEHRVGVLKILQRHGALAHADRVGQADAGRLVAHVGAVWEVVAAVFAHEQLVQERRFVRRAAGGVKLGHARIRQRAKRGTDTRGGFVPADFNVAILRRVVAHRVGQAAGVFQRMIVPFPQFRHGVRGEKFRRGAFGGGLPRHGLGAVLAELERRGVFRVGPGAAGTVEPDRLVHPVQRFHRTRHIHLLPDRAGDRAQRTPTTGGSLIGMHGLVEDGLVARAFGRFVFTGFGHGHGGALAKACVRSYAAGCRQPGRRAPTGMPSMRA